MRTLKVWAPRANNVQVKIAERFYPLQPEERGWWKGDVAEAQPGMQYFFVLDGGRPVPDPRSGFQPQGVDGPSEIVDHSAFRWTDDLWQARPLASAIIYELHVGTFTKAGTFLSLIERLDYLVALGITHIELMPVNEFSGAWGWGYDGVDLYSPHHEYGRPDDLKALVDACHAKGLAVLLDVVYNHFGPAGNYVNESGPYFTHAYQTPWGSAVNLDRRGSHEVRRFFVDNALMWLRDYHFDGLRLDAVHAFYDKSAVHFLEELAAEVDVLASQLGRNLALIAESDLNDPRLVTSRERGGLGMDAQWSDDFHHALHAVLAGERNGYYEDFGSLDQLAKALKEVFVYNGIYSVHRDRMHGRPVVGLSGHRFLGYSQTHDQVGNRAQGDRLCHLVSPGRAKMAAALVLTSPFIPMLFQGEEYAASSPFQYFTQHDADLGRQVSEGRGNEFRAFGWKPEEIPDPQDQETFLRSKLRWNEIEREPHAEMLDWYKRLIALRRSTADLTDGRLTKVEVRFDSRAKWLVMKRGRVQVVCNLANNKQEIPVCGASTNLIAADEQYRLRAGCLELPTDGVAILH